MSQKPNFFAAFAVICVLTTSAQAIAQSLPGSLIQPTQAASTAPTLSGAPSQLIDQSGLSSGYTSGVTLATSAASTTHFDITSMNGFSTNQLAGGFSPFVLSFDLGATESISALRLWSSTTAIDGLRGDVEDFEVFSDNDFDPTNGGLVSLGSFTAATQPAVNDRPAEDFALNVATSQFFHVQVDSNIDNSINTSLGEVAFITLAAVPEPSALVLLTAMAGGLMTRRRRNLL